MASSTVTFPPTISWLPRTARTSSTSVLPACASKGQARTRPPSELGGSPHPNNTALPRPMREVMSTPSDAFLALRLRVSVPMTRLTSRFLRRILIMHPRRSSMPSRAPARLSQARDFILRPRWQKCSPARLDRETTGHLLAQMGRSTMPKWRRVRMLLSATQAKAGRGPLEACC